MYDGKARQADQVNQKLIAKYDSLQRYIKLSEAGEAEIAAALPKVQVSKFIEENRKDFDDLKQGTDSIKSQMEGLDSITHELKGVLTQINYNEVAQNYLKDSQQSKEALL